MNAIRTINLTKQILLISFIFFVSCQKQTEVSTPTQKSLSENAFFSRAKISANQIERDLVDTVIDFCKRADNISHFSDAVINKYGYPRWDLIMTLQNENGLKTLFVPVVDSADRVRLIISAYQQSKDKFLFKMIAKDMQQPGLPESSNDNKVFTRQSLAGIFNSLEKQVIALKNLPKSPSSNIETTRGLGIGISWECWSMSWVDENGGVFVTNWQCSYTIRVTQSAYGWISSNVPDLPEIGGGGGGGGGEGGDGLDPGEDCSVLSARIINEALKFTVVNRIQNINTISETNETRQREYKWEVCKADNGSWSLTSIEKGVHEKTQNTDPNLRWKWVSLEHQSIGREGFVLGADIEFSERSKLIELGEYVSLIKLGVNIKVTLICKGFPISHEKNANSILIVHANG